MLKRIASIASLCIFLSSTTFAQLNRGFISGTVQDQSGAVLVGATVTITNNATNISRDMASNESGLFRFAAVEPGSYSVEFQKDGFERKRLPNVTVGPTQEVVLNESLGLSTSSTVVEVQDIPPIEVLDIPDEYECMDPQLQELLRLTLDPEIDALLSSNETA